MKKNRIFLLLCCALLPALLRAQAPQERESILIISSYNPDTRRMSGFITEFERNIMASGIPCDIYVETLECKSINDAPIWMSQTENMISRYENKGLRAIVLLGQEAWASFVSLGHIPKDVMCFCCYVSSNGIVLPPPEDSLGMWLPPSINYMNMTDSLNNVGGMLNKYDVRRNIELVRSLFPEAENIAFISDNTYGGISLQALVREEMKNYPDMNLVLVDSREGDDAMHETYASLSHRSAAILGTWRVGRDGEYLMQRSLNDLVQLNPRIPVFSISQIGIGDVAVGGYVPKYENAASVIASQIKKYYASGKIDGTHFRLTDGQYLFDSRKLKELKIAEYALPKGSVVEDTVAAKLSKYSHYIELLVAGIVLLVLLLVFVAALFLRTRRLKRTLEEREGQLVVAREKAEESDMLKSAFLANMSHEIRTPLNAIVGFSEIIALTEDEVEKAEYLNIIQKNSNLLLQLINDILDLSRIESGKSEMNFQLVEMTGLIDEVEKVHRLKMKTGIRLNVIRPDEEIWIMVDRNRITQVLFNFLSNAIKNTHEGAITLGLEVCGEWLKVYVTDTGCGIAKEKLPLIFNRFEKLNDFVQGTGLGLPICQSIVERLGGKISVESEVGVGSTFVMTLPYRQFVLGADGEPVEINAHVERRSDGRKKILIAEDTESNFMQINILLKKDYTISWVTNGEEAVNSFLHERPDLILMDIRMPVMNGIQATEKIRTIDIDLPIVAVTANAFLIEQQQALAAGCNDIIAKPYTYERLKETIIKYI